MGLHGWSLHSLGNLMRYFNTQMSIFFLFLSLNRISCISVRAHCLLSCHWIALRRAQLLHVTVPHQFFTHAGKIPLSFLRGQDQEVSEDRGIQTLISKVLPFFPVIPSRYFQEKRSDYWIISRSFHFTCVQTLQLD